MTQRARDVLRKYEGMLRKMPGVVDAWVEGDEIVVAIRRFFFRIFIPRKLEGVKVRTIVTGWLRPHREKTEHKEEPSLEEELRAEIEEMKNAKAEEWRARGYPPGLVEKALLMADEWAEKMASWALELIGEDESKKLKALRNVYPRALEAAETWITKLGEMVKREKEKG